MNVFLGQRPSNLLSPALHSGLRTQIDW